MEVKDLFSKPCVIGVIANPNEGKSMMLYYFLEKLKKDYTFKTYSYGLRSEVEGIEKIHSVAELEEIKNSIIILDEYTTLIDIQNRKIKRQVENTIRLIFHNNNVLLLCGLGQNYPKFISSKLNITIYKKVLLADLINGSSVARNILNYKGYELGSTILNLDIDEAIVFMNGKYEKIKIPYIKKYDSKKDNKNILNTIEKKDIKKETKNNTLNIDVETFCDGKRTEKKSINVRNNVEKIKSTKNLKV